MHGVRHGPNIVLPVYVWALTLLTHEVISHCFRRYLGAPKELRYAAHADAPFAVTPSSSLQQESCNASKHVPVVHVQQGARCQLGGTDARACAKVFHG